MGEETTNTEVNEAAPETKKAERMSVPTLRPVEGRLFSVSTEDIHVREGFNPRLVTEDITELKRSVEVCGMLDPLRVRKLSNGSLELVKGERRLRVAKELGMRQVTVLLMPSKTTERVALTTALALNERKPLLAIEQATAFKHAVALGADVAALSRLLGRTQAYIKDRLLLLGASTKVQEAVDKGEVPVSYAIEAVKAYRKDPDAQDKMIDSAKSGRAARAQERRVAKRARVRLREEERVQSRVDSDEGKKQMSKRRAVRLLDLLVTDYVAFVRARLPAKRSTREFAKLMDDLKRIRNMKRDGLLSQ